MSPRAPSFRLSAVAFAVLTFFAEVLLEDFHWRWAVEPECVDQPAEA